MGFVLAQADEVDGWEEVQPSGVDGKTLGESSHLSYVIQVLRTSATTQTHLSPSFGFFE